MSSYIIYIISVSFQLTGGIALLVDVFVNKKEKVYAGFYGNIRWHDKNNIEDVKEDDMKIIRNIIFPIELGKISFIILILGYLLSPIGSINNENAANTIILIIIFTIFINAIIFIVTYILAIKKSQSKKYKEMIVDQQNTKQ